MSSYCVEGICVLCGNRLPYSPGRRACRVTCTALLEMDSSFANAEAAEAAQERYKAGEEARARKRAEKKAALELRLEKAKKLREKRRARIAGKNAFRKQLAFATATADGDVRRVSGDTSLSEGTVKKALEVVTDEVATATGN